MDSARRDLADDREARDQCPGEVAVAPAQEVHERRCEHRGPTFAVSGWPMLQRPRVERGEGPRHLADGVERPVAPGGCVWAQSHAGVDGKVRVYLHPRRQRERMLQLRGDAHVFGLVDVSRDARRRSVPGTGYVLLPAGGNIAADLRLEGC